MAEAGKFLKKFSYMKKERMSTGILPLDIVFNNGFELGGCYAIASKPGGGKSTLILQLCKNLIDAGQSVVYLDIEQGVKEEQLKSTGLIDYIEPQKKEDYPRFFITNEIYSYNDAQNAIRDIIELKKSGKFNYSMIAADSLSSLVSEQILSGDAEATTMAADARPLSKVIKSIRGPLGVNGITLFNIVQAASNMNMNPMLHGTDDWVAKVSKAIEHAVDALLILEHPQFTKYKIMGKKKTPEGEVDTEIGYWGKLYTTKARLGLNRIKINIPMIAGVGADNLMYLEKVLLDTGVFISRGETYKYNDSQGKEQKIVGTDNYNNFVKENYEMFVKMMYDLGYFNLTNTETISQVASIEPASVGDGSVSIDELRNEDNDISKQDKDFI